MRRSLSVLFTACALSAAAAETPRTVTLDVQKMTCATCPLTVHQVLKRQPGVVDAKVDLATASARVTFDATKGQPEQFARAVSEAGYPATVRP